MSSQWKRNEPKRPSPFQAPAPPAPSPFQAPAPPAPVKSREPAPSGIQARAAAAPAPAYGPPPVPSKEAPPFLQLFVTACFEECLKLEWKCNPSTTSRDSMHRVEFHVEMVLDRSENRHPDDDVKPRRPPKNAMVKKVEMGHETTACIQNMPTARNFLVAVVATHKPTNPTRGRSAWVSCATLNPKERIKELGNLDPFNIPRLSCKTCSCPQFVALRWTLNSSSSMPCRCCGCACDDHVAVEVGPILRARAEKFCKRNRREECTALPAEALEWDTRECNLWFCSDGLVHPRTVRGMFRSPPQSGPDRGGNPQVADDYDQDGLPLCGGGPPNPEGMLGRVSVVTPTTESRQHFHDSLWKCFKAQTWPDKELVVIETYVEHHSTFFEKLAEKDPRVVYVRFQRPQGEDWSIGLKRICPHRATTGAPTSQTKLPMR